MNLEDIKKLKPGMRVKVIRRTNIGYNNHLLNDNNGGFKEGDIITIGRITNRANTYSGYWLENEEGFAICPSMVDFVNTLREITLDDLRAAFEKWAFTEAAENPYDMDELNASFREFLERRGLYEMPRM